MRLKEKISRLEELAVRYREAVEAEPDIYISLIGVTDQPIHIQGWSMKSRRKRPAKNRRNS